MIKTKRTNNFWNTVYTFITIVLIIGLTLYCKILNDKLKESKEYIKSNYVNVSQGQYAVAFHFQGEDKLTKNVFDSFLELKAWVKRFEDYSLEDAGFIYETDYGTAYKAIKTNADLKQYLEIELEKLDKKCKK